MPSAWYSRVMIWHRLLRPNFPGEKLERPGEPRRAPVAPVNKIVPHWDSSIAGKTHFVDQNAPCKLIFVKFSNSSDVVSRIFLPLTRRAPALYTRTCTGPSSLEILLKLAMTESSTRRSVM
jgi:hypothetical protein